MKYSGTFRIKSPSWITRNGLSIATLGSSYGLVRLGLDGIWRVEIAGADNPNCFDSQEDAEGYVSDMLMGKVADDLVRVG